MKLLVDSHVFVWWLENSKLLTEELKTSIRTDRFVYISPVTPWELGHKQAQGRFNGPPDVGTRVAEFLELPITSRHAAEAAALPLHHRDPFDRMLVAQARCERLTLVTHDKHIQKYDVDLLVV